MYHLWFLPAIAAVYMILPLLRAAFADKKNCRYYLLLFFIVQLVLPTIQKLGIPKVDMFFRLYSRIPFSLCVGYVSYFVLGYYLSTEDFTQRMRRGFYILGAAGLAVAVGIDGYLSVSRGSAVIILDDLFSLNTALLACAVFVGIRYLPWKMDRFASLLKKVSRLTFGIYLIHPLFLGIMTKHGAILDKMNILIRIPVTAVAVFLCIGGVIWCISRIPFVNKYII